MCTAVEFCEYSEKTGVGKVTANKFTLGLGTHLLATSWEALARTGETQETWTE